MTNEPIEELYFKWLYGQVGSVRLRNRSRTYWSLLKQLHSTEFTWIIPKDENRAEDGRRLRYEFLDDMNLEVDEDWLDLGCSMLELLIGIARRFAFIVDDDPKDWFWHFIGNLDLADYNDMEYDRDYNYHNRHVKQILDRVILRRYRRNGEGGIFPLRYPEYDQRNLELWYQMHAYILELD